jgi:hypothetical protein
MNEDKDIIWTQDERSLEKILKYGSDEQKVQLQKASTLIQGLIELTEKVRQRNENKRNNNRDSSTE